MVIRDFSDVDTSACVNLRFPPSVKYKHMACRPYESEEAVQLYGMLENIYVYGSSSYSHEGSHSARSVSIVTPRNHSRRRLVGKLPNPGNISTSPVVIRSFERAVKLEFLVRDQVIISDVYRRRRAESFGSRISSTSV